MKAVSLGHRIVRTHILTDANTLEIPINQIKPLPYILFNG